jgi:hypothetical protein
VCIYSVRTHIFTSLLPCKAHFSILNPSYFESQIFSSGLSLSSLLEKKDVVSPP